MVAHSVFQGGPSLSCINPAIYHYLMTDNVEQSIMTYPLQADDILLNAGTADLLQLIKQVHIMPYNNNIIILLLCQLAHSHVLCHPPKENHNNNNYYAWVYGSYLHDYTRWVGGAVH